MTIKGFRAGVTRQQIEARLGPGTATEGGWFWSPPLNFKPGGPLPVITFEQLSLCKYKNRWCLSGSQFEYGSQKFVTQYRCADSIEQRTVQQHFGPGRLNGPGDDLFLDYSSPDVSRAGLSFGINAEDGWPHSRRRITRTTLSWPAESQAFK
ncbi:MAG: hypothetical protein U0931_08255 [Vulcanimicrobiota bacterium]